MTPAPLKKGETVRMVATSGGLQTFPATLER